MSCGGEREGRGTKWGCGCSEGLESVKFSGVRVEEGWVDVMCGEDGLDVCESLLKIRGWGGGGRGVVRVKGKTVGDDGASGVGAKDGSTAVVGESWAEVPARGCTG